MDLAIDPQRDLVRRPTLERIAGFGLTPVTHIAQQSQLLAKWRAGHIVIQDGRLVAVYGRWWPYIGNHLRVAWDQRFRPTADNRCELFYHAPLSAPQFLTLSYIHSGEKTALASVYAATLVLDEIAKLKGSLAIVCNVTNDKISDRFLARWGWESHCPHLAGRHFIKRFYGNFPKIPQTWRNRLTL